MDGGWAEKRKEKEMLMQMIFLFQRSFTSTHAADSKTYANRSV